MEKHGEIMDKKIIYAVIVGIVLFVVAIALMIYANQEGLQIILFFMTFFVVGFIATGVKRGFLLSFILALIFSIAREATLSPQNFNDINVVAAILILSVIASAICGVLGAVGGFIGKKIFK